MAQLPSTLPQLLCWSRKDRLPERGRPRRGAAALQFDLVLTNLPFQDTLRRGKTPHKLWINFTFAVFDRLLRDGGILCQVSPASFQSPSSKVLALMRTHRTAGYRGM
jgi:hypothetical protein